MGMRVGIGSGDRRPPGQQRALLPLFDLRAAARGLEVTHHKIGVIDNAPAVGAKLQAVVDVVVVDREGGAEAAEPLEQLVPGHHAGAGDGQQVAGDLEAVGVSGGIAGPAVVGMAGQSAFETDAAVLEPSVFE
jgi:hypothetical protein